MRYLSLLFMCSCILPAASDWVLVRTTDCTEVEGQANIAVFGNRSVLSFHSGTAPSDKEKELITAGIAAIQGSDRGARDAAVEELTAIGVPVVTRFSRR